MNKQRQGICPEHKSVMAQKEGVNHILHLLISIFTFGFWSFVWIGLIIKNGTKPYRCIKCGSPVEKV